LDEKTREKIVASFEEALRKVGAQSYEEGIETTEKLLRFVSGGLDAIRTPDTLRETLDSLPPLSRRDRIILLFLMAHLPHLLRWGFKKMAEDAVRTLPAMNGGRPSAMTADQVQEALDYVSKLVRQGVSLEIAKKRAGQKFACSLRTIERYWATRGEPTEDTPTIDEAISVLSKW
jgi:hypothetical protein